MYSVHEPRIGSGAACPHAHLEVAGCAAGQGFCPAAVEEEVAQEGPQCTLNVVERRVVRVEYRTRVEKIYLDLGCDGVPSSGEVVDTCGVCAGTNSTCADCNGVPFGGAAVDLCGACQANISDFCALDCAGTPVGNRTVDICDVCDGDNSTCTTSPFRLTVDAACPDAGSDDAIAMRQAIADQYSVDVSRVKLGCGTGAGRRRQLQSSALLIDIAADLGDEIDPAGLSSVSGLSTASATVAAASYDCHGNLVPAGSVPPRPDACGVCGGDNSSCADCAGVPDGPSTTDRCGSCDANATTDCSLDCHGTWGGGARLDACDVCGGSNGCVLCSAGKEKCDPLDPDCPPSTGCQDCPSNAHALPGEQCAVCPDGSLASEDRAACSRCPAGLAGRGGVCVACPAAKQPSEDSAECRACPSGKQKPAGGTDCTFCVAGSEPLRDQSNGCRLCDSGYRSSAQETYGLCQPCGRGQQPTDDRFRPTLSGATRCSECAVGRFSDFDDALSVSHRCLACEDMMTTGQTGSADRSACVCAPDLFDTLQVGLIFGHPAMFNDSQSRELMAVATPEIARGRRCVPCPTGKEDGLQFMACVDGQPPSLAAGWAVLATVAGPAGEDNETSLSASPSSYKDNETRHFFKCPFGTSGCGPIQDLGLHGALAANCGLGYTGVLCGACVEPGFAQTGRGCTPCRSSDWLMLGVVCGAVVLCCGLLAWAVSCCSSSTAAGLLLWGGVMQRLWPRLSQSASVFIQNYQIVTRIPLITGIVFPSPLVDIFRIIGGFVDGAVDLIPSVACTLGGSFVRRFVLKCALPAVLILGVLVSHRVRVWQMHKRMPLDPVGSKKTWRQKVARALVRNHLVQSTSSWILAIVYLLYPSVSAGILEAFFCRQVADDGTRLLSADHRIVCYGPGGKMDEFYKQLFIAAAVLSAVWSLGVPLVFGLQLYRHREMIETGNHDYVAVAFLRPMFIFLRPECYMFEVFFMIEQLLMAALVRMVQVYTGGYFCVALLSMTITTTMMCMIIAHRPSRTGPYNTANIMAHAFMLMTIYSTVALKNPMPEDSWATPARIVMAMTVCQIPFWVYLIHISFVNLRTMYSRSKVDAIRHRRRTNAYEEEQHGKAKMLSVGHFAAEVVYMSAAAKGCEADVADFAKFSHRKQARIKARQQLEDYDAGHGNLSREEFESLKQFMDELPVDYDDYDDLQTDDLQTEDVAGNEAEEREHARACASMREHANATAAVEALRQQEQAARVRIENAKARNDAAAKRVRHPGLKLNTPALLFCMSWCPEFEFRGT